jgi:superfamily II RNA helicase
MSTSDLEEIISQFTLTYNTVINLVKNHTPEERERILKSSFDYYIRRKERKHMWVMRRYKQYLRVLNNLKYLDGEKVTNKGEFASRVYTHELLVTEIFVTGLYKKLDLIALAILITTIMYEERRDDHFKFDRETNYYEKINSIISRNPLVANEINHINLKRMCLIVRYWCEGLNFTELLDTTNLEEGDVVHMFRNTIDLARQIRHATDNPDIIEKMEKIIDMFDRDVVKLSF